MSGENVGKLLFEITNYGSAWFRGVIKAETAKTFAVLEPGRSSESRRFKSQSDVIMAADTDPQAAIGRFAATYNSFREEVKAAEDAHVAVRKRQRQAAIDALLAVSQ